MIYLNKRPLLEESFKSFVRSIDIAYALTEETKRSPNGRNDNEETWVREMMKTHSSDIKDIKTATQNLKDLISANKNQDRYEKDTMNGKFDDLKNVSYEPLSVVKQSRPFMSYPFPLNILYIAKQIFI